jgi:hypothetical protein
MDAFARELDRLGRRLRLRGVLRRASRGAFLAAVGAGLALLAVRLLSWPVSAAAVLAALGIAVGALFARELLRPFGRPQAAAALDRLLGLEERLSTALEASGPLQGLQAADAARALSAARLPAAPLPLEAKLSAAALVVLLGLAALPAFDGREGAAEVRLRRLLEGEREKILAAAPDSVEVREAVEELPRLSPERALLRLEALNRRMAEKWLAGGAGSAEAKRVLDAAGAAADGLGAELGERGSTVHARAPVVAEAKLRRRLEEIPSGEADGGLPPTTATAVLSRNDWDPRYDPVVRSYFRGRP